MRCELGVSCVSHYLWKVGEEADWGEGEARRQAWWSLCQPARELWTSNCPSELPNWMWLLLLPLSGPGCKIPWEGPNLRRGTLCNGGRFWKSYQLGSWPHFLELGSKSCLEGWTWWHISISTIVHSLSHSPPLLHIYSGSSSSRILMNLSSWGNLRRGTNHKPHCGSWSQGHNSHIISLPHYPF